MDLGSVQYQKVQTQKKTNWHDQHLWSRKLQLSSILTLIFLVISLSLLVVVLAIAPFDEIYTRLICAAVFNFLGLLSSLVPQCLFWNDKLAKSSQLVGKFDYLDRLLKDSNRPRVPRPAATAVVVETPHSINTKSMPSLGGAARLDRLVIRATVVDADI